MKWAAYSVVAGAACLVMACSGGSNDANKPPAPSSTTTTSAPTTSAAAPLTGDALFSRRLATLGIDTEGKDYLYIPAAHADCDALTQTTLPDDQKFSKIVELSMKLGKFANRRSAEDFMKASIEAYCPTFQRLVPQ